MYEVDNILDLLSRYGEGTVQQLLDSFSCEKNPEIEGFVHDLLLGVFAIANKMLMVDTSNIGSTVIKKMKTFGKFDESSGRITVPGILKFIDPVKFLNR